MGSAPRREGKGHTRKAGVGAAIERRTGRGRGLCRGAEATGVLPGCGKGETGSNVLRKCHQLGKDRISPSPLQYTVVFSKFKSAVDTPRQNE